MRARPRSCPREMRTSGRQIPKAAEFSRGTEGAPQAVMAKINSFRDLFVWQKAMDLAVRCYGVSRRMPKDEQGVLGYQIRKCAVSLPSNIAEGKARQSTAIYMNHLWIAHGSARMLKGLVQSLERKCAWNLLA